MFSRVHWTRSAILSSLLPLLLGMLLSVSCSRDGDTFLVSSSRPPSDFEPPAGSDQLDRRADLPGAVLTLVALGGASGADGTFQVGDRPIVTFTLRRHDGTELPLSSLDFANILISGPTVNYQRVIASQDDLVAESKRNSDGSYTYSFSETIPATYLPPLNDTGSFGPADGERQGQPLVAGTYTLGIEMFREYVIEGESHRDVGNLTHDFLLGGATTLQSREVFTAANCNTCHTSLRAHGGIRRDPTLCLLCHTSGAEDRNLPGVADGTPGASIDMRVMIHKIHNGAHLPSVLGVSTKTDGTRVYNRDEQPYRLVGFGDFVHDYSDVHYPLFPSFEYAMPKDAGYTGLSGAAQELEDTMLTGVTDCASCHGDPDGDGPLPAPAQGSQALSQPTARACGSCHDDIDWTRPYTANNQTMPPQTNDSQCVSCHPASGNTLSALEGHVHPLADPDVDPGVHFEIVSIDESGDNDDDGTFDVGESVSVTFNLLDDAGNAVSPSIVNRIELALRGPSENPQLLNFIRPPLSILNAGPPYQTNVPELVHLDFIGTATSSPDEVFQTSRAPHWNVSGATTTVRVRTATGPATTMLSAAGVPFQNFIDVDDGSVFANDQYLVIDDGQPEQEVVRIQWVEGNRLWLGSIDATAHQPWLRQAHAVNASVDFVTLTTVDSADYSLNAATGEITEGPGGIPDGDVVVSYTTDYVVPSRYPTPLNDSPDLGEAAGEWGGKLLVPGTYSLAIWGRRAVSLELFGETNDYTVPSHAGTIDFVGGDGKIEPSRIIDSGESCASCHGFLTFHGGNRGGFDACVACHSSAGAEDLPPYESRSTSFPTPALSIDFRTMLHAIHRGADLHEPESYVVVGFGNNPHTYEEVHFPAMPNGAADCQACHGRDNFAWLEPSDRDHPFEPGTPVLEWTSVCSSCHQSPAAHAHAAVQTAPDGTESCSICHGPGGDQDVELVHRAR